MVRRIKNVDRGDLWVPLAIYAGLSAVAAICMGIEGRWASVETYPADLGEQFFRFCREGFTLLMMIAAPPFFGFMLPITLLHEWIGWWALPALLAPFFLVSWMVVGWSRLRARRATREG